MNIMSLLSNPGSLMDSIKQFETLGTDIIELLKRVEANQIETLEHLEELLHVKQNKEGVFHVEQLSEDSANV